MKFNIQLLIGSLFLFIVILWKNNDAEAFNLAGSYISGDTISLDSLKQRATKAVEESAKLRPTATALQSEFLDYKQKAKQSKGGAIDEANDGYDMATEAVKDCDEIDKIGKKVAMLTPKKVKIQDVLKMILIAEKKVHNIKYMIHQTEDRRKEVQFELKGR